MALSKSACTFSSPQAHPRRLSLHKSNTIYFFLLMLFLLSFFLDCPITFSMLSPFFIYFYPHHISTIHFHLTSLLLWHLLLFTFEEDGGRNLLSCGLLCSGHFLINMADKTIVYHLTWMQKATPDHKLPYCPLTSTLFRLQLPLRIL